jgi:hypothetical protein
MPPNATTQDKDELKFTTEPKRTILLALCISGLYGVGIVSAAIAAKITIDASHAGQTAVPYIPWAFAYVSIIAGMLSVVYGFFFRPRALSIKPDRVAFLKWDGEGKRMAKGELKGFEASAHRIVLKSDTKTLVIGKMFADWEKLRKALETWAGRTAASP